MDVAGLPHRDVTPIGEAMIIDLQRRIHECGRIRIGQQVPTGSNGRTRPEKLSTFRLTSPDRQRLDDAATLWGGTVAAWEAPAGPQWELITESDTLAVVVPPSEMSFSQHLELWSAGGCQRRCDGVTDSIGDRPCVCDPENRECQIHTRLSVMLADLPGLGVWRIDSSGYNAAVELSGAVQVLQAATGRGMLLPARLRLEKRQVKRIDDRGKPQTRNFAVPVLDVQITPAQLLGGGQGIQLDTSRPQLPTATNNGHTGQAQLDAPRLTPVPAAIEPGPSIAAQSAPPAPKPRRANSAAEIPPSGRNRRGGAGAATPEPPSIATPDSPPADAVEPAGDRMSQPQQRKLFALLREHEDITDRWDWASGILGRDVTSYGQLSQGDAARLIDDLERGGAVEVPDAEPDAEADATRDA